MSDDHVLLPPLLRDAFNYVSGTAPVFIGHIRLAIKQGMTPDDIYMYYMRQDETRKAFWKQIKYAAMYIQKNDLDNP